VSIFGGSPVGFVLPRILEDNVIGVGWTTRTKHQKGKESDGSERRARI